MALFCLHTPFVCGFTRRGTTVGDPNLRVLCRYNDMSYSTKQLCAVPRKDALQQLVDIMDVKVEKKWSWQR